MNNMSPYVEKSAFLENIFKSIISLVSFFLLVVALLVVVVGTGGVIAIIGAIGLAYFGMGALKSFCTKFWKALFGTIKVGNCPYCCNGIKLFDSKALGFDCPICKNRIVVQSKYFVSINK